MMKDVRIFFTKHGRLKYISHLDVARMMQRALKKAGLPVWYTEGFNPHMYITFALPLSLGYESDYELMDFRITEEIGFDEIKSSLNAALPEEIRVFSAAQPAEKINMIAAAEYSVQIISKPLSPDLALEKFNEFISQEQIYAEKKTKRRGFISVDIKPDVIINELCRNESGISFTLRLPAGERTVNPSLLLGEFDKFSQNSAFLTRVKRTAVYDKNGAEFR